MLVLSRKVNERVFIDGVGWVMVIEIRGDKVRLGFDVDRNVAVHREEVLAAINSQPEQAEQEATGEETPETIA